MISHMHLYSSSFSGDKSNIYTRNQHQSCPPSTEIARIGDGKKIVSLEYIAEEQLIMVIAGRQRQVKLVPVRALGGDDVEWIKVSILFFHNVIILQDKKIRYAKI